MFKISREFKLTVLAVFFAFFFFIFFKGDLSFLKSKQYPEPPALEQVAQNEASTNPKALTAEELVKTGNPELKNGPVKEKAEETVQSANQKVGKKPEGSVAGVKESPKPAEGVAGNMENAPNAEEATEDVQSANQRRDMYSVTFYINSEKFETSVLPQSTAYDLMVSLRNQGRINFSGENYSGLGFFVKEINGIKNNPKTGEFWFYYINNQSAWVGVSGYELKPGDIISWKYAKDTL